MQARIPMMMLAALLASTVAVAGPSVPKNQVKALPAEVQAQFDPALEELTELQKKLVNAQMQADLAKSGIKADKMDEKATAAQIKADKAALKAAKEAGDKSAKQAAKAAIEASKAEKEEAQADTDSAAARHDLAKAEVKLIQAEIGLKEATVEAQRAQAVFDHEMEIDINMYKTAQSKAEIDFQEARAAVELARAKVSMKGGDPADVQGSDTPAPEGDAAE